MRRNRATRRRGSIHLRPDQGGWDSQLFDRLTSGVRIYKLHGSLDWYRDTEEYAIFSREYPQEDRQPVEDPEPLLIFGIPNKLTPTDPFLHLSYTFSQRVKQAKVIAILGYGFGDDYVNQILVQGMSQDSRKKMIVVGRDSAKARSTLLASFPNGETFLKAERIDFIDGGAKAAINNGSLLAHITWLVQDVTESGPF